LYEVGDMVYCGGSGVCRVKDIAKRKFPGEEESRLYYTMEPLYQEYTVHTPVNGSKVFMRDIITREEAVMLIDKIPSMQVEPYNNKTVSQLTAHYEASLQKHDCADLIELIESIYAKRQIAKDQRRKLGDVDRRFMEQAEELLFSELSVALEIPIDEVPEYIATRVKAIENREGKQEEP
jgi:CarD family transcriptional regulator